MASLPIWLQRWNFIERARLERQLWEAFERREDLEALVESCRQAASGGTAADRFRLEIWQATLPRIRRLETMMAAQPRPAERDAD